MKQRCQISGEEFEISEDDLNLLEKLSPTVGDKTYRLPPPTISSTERRRKRLAFRNERRLYQRQCSLSGKNIISMYTASPKEFPEKF